MHFVLGTILSFASPAAGLLRALRSLGYSYSLLRIVLPVTNSYRVPLILLFLILGNVLTDCGGRILLRVPSLLVISGV